MDILTGYRNTIFYACVGTVINILMTIALAYPLSRRDFRGRGILTALCTITMFFSGGMIPTFLVIKDIGLYNTVWAMMIPKCISVWNMFLLRNYFQHSVPEELIESARVDGASEWRTLWQIVLPLSKSILGGAGYFLCGRTLECLFRRAALSGGSGALPAAGNPAEILLQGQGGLLDMGGVINTVISC